MAKLNNINMANTLNIQNPFEQEENLNSWFKEDTFYSNSKNSQLLEFKNYLKLLPSYQNNPIMSFQESYKNFVNTITKHSITATLIMLLALSTVSVAAAQLFAPEEYKPSNVIGLTKKPETKINSAVPLEEVVGEEVKKEESTGLDIYRFDGFVIVDGGKYSFFFEGYDKKIYLLKNVAESDEVFKAISLVGGKGEEFKLQFKITGESVYRPQEVKLLGESGSKKVDYEFVSVKKIEQVSVEVKNEIKPLVADGENDVILIDSCDLQSKVKKNILYGGKSTEGYTYEKQPSLFLRYKTAPFGPGFAVQIDCTAKAITFDEFNKTVKRSSAPVENTKYFEDDENLGPISKENISKDTICKEIGLSEFLCNQVKNQVKVLVPLAEGGVTAYYFSTENKSYIISYVGITLTESPIKLESFKGNNTSTKTYTNQYFPDFKLVYPEDWKFETSTSEIYIEGLLKRTITLSKGETTVFIKLGILGDGSTACTASDNQTNINENIVRYNYRDSVSYSPRNQSSDCFLMESNIDANNYPQFKSFKTNDGLEPYKNAKVVEFATTIETNNKNYLSEIDQIISQSTFK